MAVRLGERVVLSLACALCLRLVRFACSLFCGTSFAIVGGGCVGLRLSGWGLDPSSRAGWVVVFCWAGLRLLPHYDILYRRPVFVRAQNGLAIMMTAHEILIEAEDNPEDRVFWSEAYAAKVCRDHGCELGEYYADQLDGGGGIKLMSDDGRYDAASVLEWLGY